MQTAISYSAKKESELYTLCMSLYLHTLCVEVRTMC